MRPRRRRRRRRLYASSAASSDSRDGPRDARGEVAGLGNRVLESMEFLKSWRER